MLEKTFEFSLAGEKKPGYKNSRKIRSGIKIGATIFLKRNLSNLKSDRTIAISDINSITQSSFYDPTLKTLCLEALKRVVPKKDVRRLKMPELLSIKQDLAYFDSFEFDSRQLDDIPKLFDLKKDLPQFVDWLMAKSRGLPRFRTGRILQ